jgi:uncharacterized protein YjbJ (UPF0337 family)
MSIGREIARRAESAKGTAKRILGRATGNNRRRNAEWRVDQAKGNIKQAAARMKKAFKR